MKKIKFTLGLLGVSFVALLIYQNREYFFTKQALSFILVPEKFQWTGPEILNAAYFGGCFVIGLLFAGYIGLVSKLRSIKAIKQINKTIALQAETIASLREELDSFRKEKEPRLITEETSTNDNFIPVDYNDADIKSLDEQSEQSGIDMLDQTSDKTVNLNK